MTQAAPAATSTIIVPERLPIFLPIEGSRAWQTILKGSGIVGTQDDGKVTLDFEGNRYGSISMERYADRVAHAADRHITRYPTIARMLVPLEEVVEIGTYMPRDSTLQINVLKLTALSDWLGNPERMEAELQRSWR